MRKTDDQLGMGRKITRRDFLGDVSVGAIGLGLTDTLLSASASSNIDYRDKNLLDSTDYPPVRTGLRGAHQGSFEAAHALRDQKISMHNPFDKEDYDLVVVGGGISGLSAAYFYAKEHGEQSRILVLDNHDDFGGHAKRNEFHQGEKMRLAIGGTHNLEYKNFSPVVWDLMDDLKIDIDRLIEQTDFHYGESGIGPTSIFFDEETFGENRLVKRADFRFSGLREMHRLVKQFPVSAKSIERWQRFYSMRKNVFEGIDSIQIELELRKMTYFAFLSKYAGLGDEEFKLLRNISHGSEGFGLDGLSAMEALRLSLPGWHLLGDFLNGEDDYSMVMFPDGNASIARLLVQKLIPTVAENASPDNIAVTRFDYSQLDVPNATKRIRLNSTAVNVVNTSKGTEITYLREGVLERVFARQSVLACNHSMIPYICPEMSSKQRAAQAYQVKCPLILTNVLLKNSDAFRKLGISGAYCPGSMHAEMYLLQGVNSGGYEHQWRDKTGPATVMFWGSISTPENLRSNSVKAQLDGSRKKMINLSFADYEREVRRVLDGLLVGQGFNVEEDVMAITVNRWPHGYSYWYLDLWDQEFNDGEYPHQIARERFGNIAIANSDAGADAYTHSAIDQAWRAVQELKSIA